MSGKCLQSSSNALVSQGGILRAFYAADLVPLETPSSTVLKPVSTTAHFENPSNFAFIWSHYTPTEFSQDISREQDSCIQPSLVKEIECAIKGRKPLLQREKAVSRSLLIGKPKEMRSQLKDGYDDMCVRSQRNYMTMLPKSGRHSARHVRSLLSHLSFRHVPWLRAICALSHNLMKNYSGEPGLVRKVDYSWGQDNSLTGLIEVSQGSEQASLKFRVPSAGIVLPVLGHTTNTPKILVTSDKSLPCHHPDLPKVETSMAISPGTCGRELLQKEFFYSPTSQSREQLVKMCHATVFSPPTPFSLKLLLFTLIFSVVSSQIHNIPTESTLTTSQHPNNFTQLSTLLSQAHTSQSTMMRTKAVSTYHTHNSSIQTTLESPDSQDSVYPKTLLLLEKLIARSPLTRECKILLLSGRKTIARRSWAYFETVPDDADAAYFLAGFCERHNISSYRGGNKNRTSSRDNESSSVPLPTEGPTSYVRPGGQISIVFPELRTESNKLVMFDEANLVIWKQSKPLKGVTNYDQFQFLVPVSMSLINTDTIEQMCSPYIGSPKNFESGDVNITAFKRIENMMLEEIQAIHKELTVVRVDLEDQPRGFLCTVAGWLDSGFCSGGDTSKLKKAIEENSDAIADNAGAINDLQVETTTLQTSFSGMLGTLSKLQETTDDRFTAVENEITDISGQLDTLKLTVACNSYLVDFAFQYSLILSEYRRTANHILELSRSAGSTIKNVRNPVLATVIPSDPSKTEGNSRDWSQCILTKSYIVYSSDSVFHLFINLRCPKPESFEMVFFPESITMAISCSDSRMTNPDLLNYALITSTPAVLSCTDKVTLYDGTEMDMGSHDISKTFISKDILCMTANAYLIRMSDLQVCDQTDLHYICYSHQIAPYPTSFTPKSHMWPYGILNTTTAVDAKKVAPYPYVRISEQMYLTTCPANINLPGVIAYAAPAGMMFSPGCGTDTWHLSPTCNAYDGTEMSSIDVARSVECVDITTENANIPFTTFSDLTRGEEGIITAMMKNMTEADKANLKAFAQQLHDDQVLNTDLVNQLQASWSNSSKNIDDYRIKVLNKTSEALAKSSQAKADAEAASSGSIPMWQLTLALALGGVGTGLGLISILLSCIKRSSSLPVDIQDLFNNNPINQTHVDYLNNLTSAFINFASSIDPNNITSHHIQVVANFTRQLGFPEPVNAGYPAPSSETTTDRIIRPSDCGFPDWSDSSEFTSIANWVVVAIFGFVFVVQLGVLLKSLFSCCDIPQQARSGVIMSVTVTVTTLCLFLVTIFEHYSVNDISKIVAHPYLWIVVMFIIGLTVPAIALSILPMIGMTVAAPIPSGNTQSPLVKLGECYELWHLQHIVASTLAAFFSVVTVVLILVLCLMYCKNSIPQDWSCSKSERAKSLFRFGRPIACKITGVLKRAAFQGDSIGDPFDQFVYIGHANPSKPVKKVLINPGSKVTGVDGDFKHIACLSGLYPHEDYDYSESVVEQRLYYMGSEGISYFTATVTVSHNKVDPKNLKKYQEEQKKKVVVDTVEDIMNENPQDDDSPGPSYDSSSGDLDDPKTVGQLFDKKTGLIKNNVKSRSNMKKLFSIISERDMMPEFSTAEEFISTMSDKSSRSQNLQRMMSKKMMERALLAIAL